jgi:hypothetical protein
MRNEVEHTRRALKPWGLSVARRAQESTDLIVQVIGEAAQVEVGAVEVVQRNLQSGIESGKVSSQPCPGKCL